MADLMCVARWPGCVDVAFVMDVSSRRVVGWRCSTSLRTDLALDALEQGSWERSRESCDITGLICHSDRGVQDVAIRCTERLAAAGAVGSVGSKGDSSDNAAAESLNGLYETEVIRRQGPWKGLDDVELATLEWVEWYDRKRLHSWCGNRPPAEYEQEHDGQTTGVSTDEPAVPSLHRTRAVHRAGEHTDSCA